MAVNAAAASVHFRAPPYRSQHWCKEGIKQTIGVAYIDRTSIFCVT
jgi:hypothetical protein